MEIQFRQELTINPRLYQAMDLLHMPMLDLQMHLKQELMMNPFLELSDEMEDDLLDPSLDDGSDEDADDDSNSDEIAEDFDDDFDLDADDYSDAQDESEEFGDDLSLTENMDEGDLTTTSQEDVDWDKVLSDNEFDTDNFVQEVDDREFYERAPSGGSTLYQSLAEQLVLLSLNDYRKEIGEEIIGDIDDDGYLQSSVPEIAFRMRVEQDEVEYVLAQIQKMEPVGVGARNLQECLLIQLRDKEMNDSLSYQIVRDHFEQLSKRHWQDISRMMGIGMKEVQDAADLVAELEPKPGRLRTGSNDENYVVPDLIVDKVEGEYVVFVNDGNLPRLRLSRAYQDVARDRKNFTGEARDFIYNKLNSANWLIQAIEQRKQTMLKVMRFIVDKQRDFFEHGITYLKPLTLREVSEAISMHESTISRVTNEKYCQTPRGVFQLKFFFSVGLTSSTGEDVSARRIKDKISKMIEAENESRPLTDQEIVTNLKKDGINIARRTVAKYRDQLGILPARMRKRI